MDRQVAHCPVPELFFEGIAHGENFAGSRQKGKNVAGRFL